MAEDDSQPRIGIEHARKDDAQEMAAGVHREAPAGARQLLVALEVGLDGVRVRQRRMEVDRHAERLRALEDRPVLALVEKAAARVPWIIAPLKPSLLTQRSSSCAAASGSAVGSAAKP